MVIATYRVRGALDVAHPENLPNLVNGSEVLVSYDRYYTSGIDKGRLQSTTDATTSLTTEYTYTSDGKIKDVRRSWPGHASVLDSHSEYDDAGRVSEVTDSNGQVTNTVYDSTGNVAETIDMYDGHTVNHYDDRGQLVERLYSDGTKTQSVYDALGRVILSVDRFKPGQGAPVLGTRTIYDSLGRVTETQRVSGISVTVTLAACAEPGRGG